MQLVNINYFKLLMALSTALDLTGSGMMKHHVRVALIASRIAHKIGLDQDTVKRVVHASLLHDIGTITFTEKAKLEDFEAADTYSHCARGRWLLEFSPLLRGLAEIVHSHHDRWDGGNKTGLSGDDIPLASRIIHLADRVDVLINNSEYVLHQRKFIINKIIDLSGRVFDPYLVEVLLDLANQESFWLDLTSGMYEKLLPKEIRYSREKVSVQGLLSIGEVLARVIDSKSRFTHIHSRLVSKVALQMSKAAGFSPGHCQAVGAAGLLHDLGKLAVPEAVLEKPGPLTSKEYDIIKCHTYYTYRILEMVDGFEDIKCWASYHHEKLNGKGYPFGLEYKKLSDESRLMAVSDIFSALVEDRPYRLGLSRHKVEQILLEKVKEKELDGKWVSLLLDNYNEMYNLKDSCKTNENPIPF
ncbi:MAG: HD domain-containing protein [Desulfotomaculum sp.]|nr:HD domain-containing protein [Desulfotomaculum sp.]